MKLRCLGPRLATFTLKQPRYCLIGFFFEVSIVEAGRCQSTISDETLDDFSLCAESEHSATCEVRKHIFGTWFVMVVQGDSGGPLTVVDSGERHTLVGLVSKRLMENQCNKVKHIISTTALVVSTPSPVGSNPMLCVLQMKSDGEICCSSHPIDSQKQKPNNAGVKVAIFFANVSFTICLMIFSKHTPPP